MLLCLLSHLVPDVQQVLEAGGDDQRAALALWKERHAAAGGDQHAHGSFRAVFPLTVCPQAAGSPNGSEGSLVAQGGRLPCAPAAHWWRRWCPCEWSGCGRCPVAGPADAGCQSPVSSTPARISSPFRGGNRWCCACAALPSKSVTRAASAGAHDTWPTEPVWHHPAVAPQMQGMYYGTTPSQRHCEHCH